MPYKDTKKQKAAQHAHYISQSDYYKQRQRDVRERNRVYVWKYLLDHPCIICGESDPIVLEFDHRDPSDKECCIAEAVAIRKFGIERLQKEIDKCDVLCANCHRRKTVKQFNANKLRY